MRLAGVRIFSLFLQDIRDGARMMIWMVSLTGFFRFALLNVRMTILLGSLDKLGMTTQKELEDDNIDSLFWMPYRKGFALRGMTIKKTVRIAAPCDKT